ncbi:MAG: ATP-binding protein, partial [Chloroflexi bacterium]|nr:ATP-binding protein [Chloroflexota bacterium]
AELAEREKCQADEVDAIIENMAEGVVVIDRSGQVVRLNRVARQIWELPWPEGQYGHIGDFAPLDFRYPDGRPIPLEEWPPHRVLRGETFRDFEAIYVRSDGKRYHLRFGASAVRDGRGNVILAINVFYDISQIREMERQREEFVSVVAHDLKGAMTIIRGYSELLLRSKDTLALPSSFQKAVETVASQTRRLDRMVDDLLDVSRIEARRLKLEKRRVDLVSLIRDMVGRTEELTKGHQVSVEVRGTIPTVDVDPDRIEQIMTNLLSNAAKYSYPETPIIVDVERREEKVMISVTNQGPGIKREDVPKLFTRFYRAEAARLEKAPGLGLGLYITEGLVEAHGGRIWVESEPGRYATFHFTLPAL